MNEISLILSNIILQIERKEYNHIHNLILMKVSNLKSPIVIDLNIIKRSPVLRGADILKMLFCLNENCIFKQEFTTDDDNYYNLLENYNITHYHWLLLQNFIRIGELPKGKVTHTGEDKIEVLQYTAEKLGGIPYLDTLLAYKKIKVKPKTIKNPDEDIEDKYNWGVFNERRSHSSYTVFLSLYSEKNGWSVTSIEKNGNIWFRKKKTN